MVSVSESKTNTKIPGTTRASSESHGSHPTIGYLTPRIGDNVSQALWSGIVDAAQEHEVNLITFAGESLLDSEGSASPANIVYDLANEGIVDGLVSWASSIGGTLDHEQVKSFHRRYQPLPMISIALPMKGIPTVAIDSYRGMRDMMTHLVEVHGYRRLSFIRGPESHYYAQERYRAYSDALKAYGIPLDSKLVTTPGDFLLSTGVEGIRLLLDERKLRPQDDFEVVVTVSDLPALGAVRELQSRGIRIPAEIALVGFNDILESRFVTPPLTSVMLPFYEQGWRAVEMLLALLAGEEVSEQLILPARLKVRQSCGCLLPSVAQAAVGPETSPAEEQTLTTALAARRDIIVDAMAQVAEPFSKEPSPGWATQLFDSFTAEVVGDPAAAGVFLQELDHILRQVMLADPQVQGWQNVISTMRRYTLPCFGNADVEATRRAEDLWGQGRVLIGEAGQRVRGHKMVQRARQTQTLRQISRALITTFDVAELADVLARDLPELGIECGYLSLYQDPHNPNSLSRLVLAYDERGRTALSPNEPGYLSQKLVPFDLSGQYRTSKPCNLVVEPLHFQEEQIGFVLFGVGPRDGTIYEVLRGQISSSLKGAFLFNEALEAQAAAEKADRLKTRLLANVSHELRTPLNVIIGCTREALDSPTAYHAALPEELLNDLVHIHHSAEHQLRVINDLLDLSRAEIDELDLYLELIDPRPLLKEVFESMKDASSRSGISWHLQLPNRLPTIQADQVRLRQILLNLLSNASKFVEQGTVTLGAEVITTDLHIWVQDTGTGIPLEMQERIFEPFVTAGHATRRLEGAGLGLTITRRLVALHHGSIRLESRPDQGSTFHVYLPLPTLSDRPSHPQQASQPVLLLISSHDRPAAEIVEFSRRQGLEIRRLQPSDDIDAIMQRVQPAAMAWDLASAIPGDWAIVRRLRSHPNLSQAPFMLYGQEPGKGTALSFGMTDFVVKPIDGPPLMAAINAISPRRDAGPILIVDDDPEILDLYQQVIAEGFAGYPIHTATDGTSALACMSETAPSLVILDLMMPEMDGFEVLDWMRANEQTRQVPVLILSSRVLTSDDVKRLERHGSVTLQSKGILSEDELVAALHQALFGTDALPRHTSALVKQAVAYFCQNYSRPLLRWELAGAVSVSEDYLSRLFRQELGLSPWEYLNRYRVLQAGQRLRHTSDSVGSIAHQVGFKDPAYFSRVFRNVTGQSPSAYRDQPD